MLEAEKAEEGGEKNSLSRLLGTINVTDALVSVLMLQNTLITAMGENEKMMTLSAVTSGVIYGVILLICVGNIAAKKKFGE